MFPLSPKLWPLHTEYMFTTRAKSNQIVGARSFEKETKRQIHGQMADKITTAHHVQFSVFSSGGFIHRERYAMWDLWWNYVLFSNSWGHLSSSLRVHLPCLCRDPGPTIRQIYALHPTLCINRTNLPCGRHNILPKFVLPGDHVTPQ